MERTGESMRPPVAIQKEATAVPHGDRDDRDEKDLQPGQCHAVANVHGIAPRVPPRNRGIPHSSVCTLRAAQASRRTEDPRTATRLP
jgi:hypothetical protein